MRDIFLINFKRLTIFARNRCLILILYHHDRQKNIFEKHFITYFRGHSQPKSNGFKSHQIHTRHGCDILGNRREKMGLQTYSLGQELLQDMPNGLNRLAKAGYTDLEIFGYREDTGKFGDYNPKIRHSSPPRIIRKWWMMPV